MTDATATKDVFLQPGEYHFGDARTHIRTVLGSCIAITMWHPQRQIGGMCHYMLPQRLDAAATRAPDGRYAEEALCLLMQEITATGTAPEEYVVRVFGGSSMFPNLPLHEGEHVGVRNAMAGKRLLDARGIRCVTIDVGGFGYRQIDFDVASGEVAVKKQVSAQPMQLTQSVPEDSR